MLRFECDYGEGAHPKILERLLETNLEQTPGYGKDEHCERAKTLIRQACGLPQSTIELYPAAPRPTRSLLPPF